MAEISVVPYNVVGGKSIPSMPMKAWDITPSDTDTFSQPVMIECRTAGDVVVLPWAGDNDGTATPVTRTLTAGQILPFAVKMVYATGTDATVGGLF